MGKGHQRMSLTNKHIFILGTAKFDGLEQSTSMNIARELSKKNFVYYIDYPITFKDYILGWKDDVIKARRPYFSLFSDGLIASGYHNLKIVICPIMLSINFLPEGVIYRSLLRINETLIRKRIKKVLKKDDIKEFIYINSFNFHYPRIADTLSTSLRVYQCVDPMIMSYDIKHGIISEDELVKKSDLVICTSRKLYNEKRLQNNNTHFIPNAASLNHSKEALTNNVHVDIFSGLNKPIVGYVGSIERRIDFELLKDVVDQNRDKTFVFVGPVTKIFVPDWFFNTENVKVTGRLPFTKMPGIIQEFDIAIIPFKMDEVSATIFPLKLFEYMGAGKPVIATNFNHDLAEFTEGMVSFCNNATSFTQELNKLLRHDSPANKRKRIQIAEKNTWENRGEQISNLLSLNLKMA